MSFNSRQYFGWHTLLWSIPIFALWWSAVVPVLLPSFAKPVGFAISQWFERERVELKLTPDGKWNIYTKILLKPQPKDAKNPFVLNMQVKTPTVFTIGLPLLWIFLLAVPGETLKRKLWHLLLGSAILIPSITLSLWLEVFRHVAQLMIGDDVGEILVTEGLYQAVHPYSTTVISLVTLLVRLSVYMNFVVIPVFIMYLLHRDFIRATILANLLHGFKQQALEK
ncbi:MAG: exosortase H-associated membrane protein [Thiotrichaceae bacterium]